VNAFLNDKRSLKDNGELSSRMWLDYKAPTDLIVEHHSKGRLVEDIRPDDFVSLRSKLAKRWGPITLGGRTRMAGACGFAVLRPQSSTGTS
jgi:hypothetical protein